MPLSEGIGVSFSFPPNFGKDRHGEGSQYKGPGQDKNRTDRGTVEGQSWGLESREGAAMSERAVFHLEITVLPRAG